MNLIDIMSYYLLLQCCISLLCRCGLLLQMDLCGLSVIQTVSHNLEPCKNSWTYWDAVWVVDLGGPKESRFR